MPSGSNPDAPLVSVIIPVYQGENRVCRAVQSALDQRYPYVEVIVVDDGSTDGTMAQLQAIANPRLTVVTQANQGVAAARNLGIAMATGNYLAFLDDDDWWLPEKLGI